MPAHTERSTERETEVNEPLRKKMLLETNCTGVQLACKSGIDVTNTPKLPTGPSTETVPKPRFEGELQDPVILERLKGTIKLKLQGSITQAVKGLLNVVSLSIEEVNYLKKVTQELQKRIRKLETISRKVEALIIESMPPAPKPAAAAVGHLLELSTVIIPPSQSQQPPNEAAVASATAYIATGTPLVTPTLPSSPHPQAQTSQIPPPQVSQLVPNPPVTAATTYSTAHLAVEATQTVASIAPLPACDFSMSSLDALSICVQPPLLLSISVSSEGVCLQWELDSAEFSFEPAAFYELYSYASSDVDPRFPLSSDVWQKVGSVEALPLPMACTLTSVQPQNIYYFAVRSIDRFQRTSEWSNVVDVQV
ncbi:Activating transcription factor 7-interacting protein 1, partial [Taenia solium]